MKPSTFELGTWFGLRVTAGQSALAGHALLWIIVSIGAIALLKIPAIEAVLGGLVCAAVHLLLEALHQFGHAAAARQTGHPMRGFRYWWIFARSIYPPDEGDLPGRIHIRRALGGPVISAAMCVVLALIALAVRPWTQTPGWIAAFVFLDGLLFFTVGALLPLGFTDGSTLLRWWGK